MRSLHQSIRHALIAIAWMACCAAVQAAQLDVVQQKIAALKIDQVAAGVYVHIGAIEDWTPASGGDVANIGFVVGNRCVAVIDTGGTPAVGQALRAAVEQTTQLPICYVINTHAHPDHILGDVAFVDAGPGLRSASLQSGSAQSEPPKFVASARYNRTLAAREPYYLNSLQRDFNLPMTHAQIVYPSVNVDKTLDLDLGERILTLQAWPTAHTDNDLTVYDQRTRTLFAGDLVFVQHMPALDGSLRGWIAAMAALQRLDVRVVVPGHGAVGTDWPAAMAAQNEYLNTLLRETRAALKRGATIQQAIDTIAVPPGSRWLLVDRFHRRNVTAAYAELEWEDDDARPAGPASAASGPAVRSGG